MINNTVLNGRLTEEPKIKYTPNGVPICDFTIAVKRNFTSDSGNDTDFIRCVAIKKTAETIGNHVKKGNLIGIEGSIQTRHYEHDLGIRIYVTEVFVRQFHFLESKTPSNQSDTSYTGR